MTVIVVANPKGGVGKSTLATNLAGYFAANGEWVALADLDKQRSAHAWLALRPDTLTKIEEWQLDVDAPAKPPKGLEKAVWIRLPGFTATGSRWRSNWRTR